MKWAFDSTSHFHNVGSIRNISEIVSVRFHLPVWHCLVYVQFGCPYHSISPALYSFFFLYFACLVFLIHLWFSWARGAKWSWSGPGQNRIIVLLAGSALMEGMVSRWANGLYLDSGPFRRFYSYPIYVCFCICSYVNQIMRANIASVFNPYD